MKRKDKIEISLKMIIVIFILILLAIPIYPCQVSKVESRYSIEIGRPTYIEHYSNYSDVHPLITVMAGFFDWRESRGSCLMDHSITLYHRANPLFLLFYLGIIILFFFLLRMFNKSLFQNKEIEVEEREINTLFLILGCIFILIACYFSIISLELFNRGHPGNITSLLILSLIIGPIYLAVGLRMIYMKYGIGYEAYLGGIILVFYFVTLAILLYGL